MSYIEKEDEEGHYLYPETIFGEDDFDNFTDDDWILVKDQKNSILSIINNKKYVYEDDNFQNFNSTEGLEGWDSTINKEFNSFGINNHKDEEKSDWHTSVFMVFDKVLLKDEYNDVINFISNNYLPACGNTNACNFITVGDCKYVVDCAGICDGPAISSNDYCIIMKKI